MEHGYKPKHRKTVLKWTCANGHTFMFGEEDWHYTQCQEIMDNGAPVPMFCMAENGCTDSSSLIWED